MKSSVVGAAAWLGVLSLVPAAAGTLACAVWPRTAKAQQPPAAGGSAPGAGSAGAPAPDGGPPPAADSDLPPAADGGVAVPAPALEEVHPPELVSSVTAQYPAAALEARQEATVVLRLSIDAAGQVNDAELVEPAGQGFDEAARAAVLQFTFKPARRGETPFPSRILYRYEFHLPPPPSVVPVPAPPTAAGLPPSAEFFGPSSEPAAPPPPPSAAAATERPVQVQVEGTSELDRRSQSAEAVTLIDTERARRESSDMGEVLARAQGVGVRRQGGLGSYARISLNGLVDDQVRLFLDDLPLELSGYPFGIANVPVNGIERIEIYSGVVPIRLGADALGGAINLVSNQDVRGTHAGAAYEVGSFDTHRLSLTARSLHEPSGFFSRVSGFFDYAKNDYPIDVEVPDEKGRLSPARVYRFHDRFRAFGGSAEVGLVDRPWAKRLLLRAFVTNDDKDYQHNIVMTVPYGGVRYGELGTGATLRYEQPLGHGIQLDAVGGYAFTRGHFHDVATCVYDWYGRCVGERSRAGETDSNPHDELSWDNSGFGRINAVWRLHPQHVIRLALAPTYLTRTGDERRQVSPRDPLTAERELFTLVNGVEYELDAFQDKLENILFAKQYFQSLHSEEPRPGDVFRRRDRASNRFGFGDALRYRFVDWLYAKVSYEFATRLPRPDEVFGDNAFITANLELRPEVSHNANIGATLDLRRTRAGSFRGIVNGFLRDADKLIVLLGNDRVQRYQNVFGARSIGVEGTVGWTSPGDWVVLDANATYQDFRNTSSGGTFGDFKGDRIPNRPYLFGNGSARFQIRNAFALRDELSVFWHTRYVHKFYRGWESIGITEFKQYIPSQTVHSLGVGYLVSNNSGTRLTTTIEVQNLTDEPTFDFFGVQRPGRAFYVKTTAEF